MDIMSASEIAAQAKPVTNLSEESYLVYFLLQGKTVVYVGSTSRGELKLISHIVMTSCGNNKADKNPYRNTGKKQFDSFFFIRCTKKNRYELEARYIVRLNPLYNKSIPQNSMYISTKEVFKKYKLRNKTLQHIINCYKIIIYKHTHVEARALEEAIKKYKTTGGNTHHGKNGNQHRG
jgi:hypothetical protein